MAFLLIHGLEGSGPEHWQSRLASRLSARGLDMAYPLLPDADSPRIDRWLDALDDELASCRRRRRPCSVIRSGRGSGFTTQRGSRQRRSHAHCSSRRRSRTTRSRRASAFVPRRSTATVSPLQRGETRLVCSTDDAWCPETSQRIGERTGIPIDWLENAGHINTDAGFGPWPAVEAWALGEGTNRARGF
jgi:predicted alpha/beta hydrolase family esterase